MIKISANISKKVPIPGTEFSSQQYGAAMEIEVSDADKPENVQGRIRELYQALSVAIDEQIGAATQGGPASNNPALSSLRRARRCWADCGTAPNASGFVRATYAGYGGDCAFCGV